MTGPVMRRWEAKVARADLDGWVETFRARVLTEMSKMDGFQSITFHAAREGDPCQVTVLSAWRDMDAIRAFAGDEPAKTYLPDFMAPFFAEHDGLATFHDVILMESRP